MIIVHLPGKNMDMNTPLIEDYSFGRIVVRGKGYSDDIKIVKGSVIPSWWRGSGHLVAAGDVSDILESRPDKLVLGTGSSGLLKVDARLRSLLGQMGIELLEAPTAEAVRLFNRLARSGENMAAGFHLTC